MSYDLKIKEAELKDIDAVIEIAKRSFYKYDLKKYGMSFDLDSVEATYKGAVLHESQKLFIAFHNDIVVGGLQAVIIPTMFNFNKRIISEFGMQADPNLSTIKQSRIILSLIAHLEDYAKEKKIDLISFSISPEFDISQKLIKKNYKLSDKVLIKEAY